MTAKPKRRAMVAEDSALVSLGLEFELRQQGIEIVGCASTVEQALVMAWTQETRSVSAAVATAVIHELQPVDERTQLWYRISRWLFDGK